MIRKKFDKARDKFRDKLAAPSDPNAPPTFVKSNKSLIITCAVVALSALILGYIVGHKQGLTVVGFDTDSEQLLQIVDKQKGQLNQLRSAVNTMVQDRDVALKTSDSLKESVAQSESQVLQIQGQRDAYRAILKQRGGFGLDVQNIFIKPLPERAFEYNLDLRYLNPNGSKISGRAEIRLINSKQTLEVPMESSLFNFQYFQRLTGRWTMPSRFTPQFIEIRLTGTTTPVIKRYRWTRGSKQQTEAPFTADIPQAKPNVE